MDAMSTRICQAALAVATLVFVLVAMSFAGFAGGSDGAGSGTGLRPVHEAVHAGPFSLRATYSIETCDQLRLEGHVLLARIGLDNSIGLDGDIAAWRSTVDRKCA